MKKPIKDDKWRLDTSALIQQHDEFRKTAAPLFDGMVQYDNRHTGATNQHKRAADFGISGEAIALYDNHDYRTALLWYLAPLFEEVEVICRFPNELITFCEQFIIHSICQLITHPWQVLRHSAAAITWWQLLGRTQLRQQLKAYRAREFDLPDPKTVEQMWQKSGKELTHRGQKPTIGNVIAIVVRRFLSQRGDHGAAGAVATRRP